MKSIIILIACLITSSFATVTFNCNYAWTPNFEVIGIVYECAMIPTVTTENQYLSSVTGEHLIGKSNLDVKLLYIEGTSQLNFFPRRIPDFFPNLIALEMANNAIEVLQGNELNDFTKLKWITFRNSKLKRIAGNLFSQTPHMTFVDFNNNFITQVGSNLLTNLPIDGLALVSFESNVCINRFARGKSSINELIQELKTKCPDSAEITTTTTTTTTPTITTTTTKPTTTTTKPTTTTTKPTTTTTKPTTTTTKPTTTTTTTTKPTTIPTTSTTISSCNAQGSNDERICSLEDHNEELDSRIEYLSAENRNLQGSVRELKIQLESVKQELSELGTEPCACK